MKFAETINGYNAMGREDAEYEACYTLTRTHTPSAIYLFSSFFIPPFSCLHGD